ncbi:hypothetical protein tinsulaeT_02420 [Thalassotalea insulae]|uniref:Uncharacterized protein n=1 Tax=Thalassotalea insulae TaxID=2056778 RepID=A0ABQ6GLU4_9GAMM|nr:hypothetical protein [Thalassotalea insulae]GLX76902.1 hypothetical protein tinsulaeT_02420 [Thalassotalea insulae]
MRNITKQMITSSTNLLLVIAIAISASASAEQSPENFTIAYLDDAKLFAEFTDELPAVINYFTQHNEQEIIDFYQQKYGEPSRSEMKRGRLTLYFNKDNQALRVIISKQGNRYQVDALRQ